MSNTNIIAVLQEQLKQKNRALASMVDIVNKSNDIIYRCIEIMALMADNNREEALKKLIDLNDFMEGLQ